MVALHAWSSIPSTRLACGPQLVCVVPAGALVMFALMHLAQLADSGDSAVMWRAVCRPHHMSNLASHSASEILAHISMLAAKL